MPLFFFAMEPVPDNKLADSGNITLADLGVSLSKKESKKKKKNARNPTRLQNPNLPLAPPAKKSDDVVIGLEELNSIEGPADPTATRGEPILESPNEQKERERLEEEEPFLPFKNDAKAIVAFVWSLPRFQKAAQDSLTEVDLIEYMKVASAYAEEDEGKSFKAFMASVRSDQTGADEKVELGANWLARMVRYRHHKSALHKKNAQVFEQQKTAANWRTVVITGLSGIVAIVVPIVQHYYPTGCATNATAAAARFLVNQTFSLL